MLSMQESRKPDVEACMQNRELSWLKFNERVLEEAGCFDNPPLERLKFVSIFCSNLDEFFMIRVGILSDYTLYAPDYYDNKTGMTAAQQLDAVFLEAAALYKLKDRQFDAVMRELEQSGIRHSQMDKLDAQQAKKMERHFRSNVAPLLSPQVIDNRHPFPHMDNKKLYIAVTLEHKSRKVFGLIAVPATLDRMLFLEDDGGFVLIEDLIYHFAHLAFNPFKVQSKTVLAVTRSGDINTDESDAVDEELDHRQLMQKLLKKRKRLAPVRLELQYPVDADFKAFFYEKLSLQEKQVYLSSSPLDLSYCFKLEDKMRNTLGKTLVRPTFLPAETLSAEQKTNLMSYVQKKDVLLSYPYESISPFIEMIRQAVDDPFVLSIKIALYRIDTQSKLAESLIRAAENGKEVLVLLELRARFDEENNIKWAQRLYEAGCQVLYGPQGYKVHSKICLITKKERNGKIQYITQIGTGNYNEKTARLYTDLSLITGNGLIGKDAAQFFTNLQLGKQDGVYARLWIAPNHFKHNLIRCIDSEKNRAEMGEEGRIIIKCNSLTDREIILKLVEASQSGVKISMIVRGICCLIPGVPGLTENITVISIVGRFLEHSRIFCFGTGEERQVYISSADLMTRNTERRVEVGCPVLDEDIKRRICEDLDIMLADNTKAWEQLPDGRYELRPLQVDMPIHSQEMFIEQSRNHALHLSEDNGRFSDGSDALQSFKAWLSALRSRLSL